MDIVLKIIGFLSIPLLVFSITMMVRSLKKERTITVRSLLLQVLIGIAMLIIYATLLKIDPPTGFSWALLVLGLLIGIWQSRTTALTVQGSRVLGKRSVWFLVIWGISFTLTQLLALFGRSEWASYGLLTIYLSTGLSVGANLGLFFRRQQALKNGETTDTRACPACGTPVQPTTRFCTGCGRELSNAIAAPAACPNCGAEITPGQRFCTGCGNQL